MFNIGLIEMMVIGTIALLVVGPERLPELARKIAQLLKTLRNAANELKDSVREELEQTGGDQWQDLKELKNDLGEFSHPQRKLENWLDNSIENTNDKPKIPPPSSK